MLYTNLNHIESATDLWQVIHDHENAMIVCGRMGPLCIPVYRIAEELASRYTSVKFFDMEFDNPELDDIHRLTEIRDWKEVPIVLYFKNGNVMKATSGIQTSEQIISILDQTFSPSV